MGLSSIMPLRRFRRPLWSAQLQRGASRSSATVAGVIYSLQWGLWLFGRMSNVLAILLTPLINRLRARTGAISFYRHLLSRGTHVPARAWQRSTERCTLCTALAAPAPDGTGRQQRPSQRGGEQPRGEARAQSPPLQRSLPPALSRLDVQASVQRVRLSVCSQGEASVSSVHKLPLEVFRTEEELRALHSGELKQLLMCVTSLVLTCCATCMSTKSLPRSSLALGIDAGSQQFSLCRRSRLLCRLSPPLLLSLSRSVSWRAERREDFHSEAGRRSSSGGDQGPSRGGAQGVVTAEAAAGGAAQGPRRRSP